MSEAAASERSWYVIAQAPDSDEAEVRIYEDIGVFGVSAKKFADDLDKITAKTINVRLNTFGGEAFDGIAIRNALAAHPARVVVHIDGIAASAGSVVAMAGDEVRMANNAFLMIHEARGGVMGEADDMRHYAELLDKINDSIASTYQERAGKTRRYWRSKMADETWFGAEEAKTEGLIDAITEPVQAAKNRFDFKVYNKAPDKARELWAAQPKTTAPETSPRGEAEPVALSPKEVSQVSETATTVSTAQPPAAVSSISAGAQTTDDKIAELKQLTNAGYFEQGRKQGIEEGRQQERNRLMEIMSAAPGKPQMALDAFLNDQGPASVKLAFQAEQRAEARAAEIAKQKDLEITRLQALLANGGHPGVTLAVVEEADPSAGRTPTEQAEWEWENKPVVRKTASSKNIYVLARAAELDGTHRTFTREAVES